jgi:hypothetical protein
VWWLEPIISATQKADIGRISVGGQPRKKLVRPHLNKKAGCGNACLQSLAYIGDHGLGQARQKKKKKKSKIQSEK